MHFFGMCSSIAFDELWGMKGGVWSKVQHAVVRARLDWVLVVIERWKMGEGLIIQNTFSYSLEEVWGLHRMCVMSFPDWGEEKNSLQMCSLIQESDPALSKHGGLKIHETFEWWNAQVFKTYKIQWLDENYLHVKHIFPFSQNTDDFYFIEVVCTSSTISCSVGVRGSDRSLWRPAFKNCSPTKMTLQLTQH